MCSRPPSASPRAPDASPPATALRTRGGRRSTALEPTSQRAQLALHGASPAEPDERGAPSSRRQVKRAEVHTGSSAYDRREEIRGPIHHVLQRAVERIIDELGLEMVVVGTRRYELPRLPEIVLREALANALAHRSYETAGTAVRVELRPSLVVVRSPAVCPSR